MFYEFSQNNSGGSFVVDKNVCHRLFIEADSASEAIRKAEDLGCYWNGVSEGQDCSCCGDRWDRTTEPIDMKELQTYPVYIWDHNKNAEKLWEKLYSEYRVVSAPKWIDEKGMKRYVGSIGFDSVEQYAQFLADEYSSGCKPEIRIFYRDGKRKEIFNQKNKK